MGEKSLMDMKPECRYKIFTHATYYLIFYSYLLLFSSSFAILWLLSRSRQHNRIRFLALNQLPTLRASVWKGTKGVSAR